jgi:glucose-1-phosphate thymidylyltransferase
MKGIILAGGSGTRLDPLTRVTSKQLLPIYNKPMIYYPLNTLLKAGIKDILIIVAPERSGEFLNLLGSGKEFGAKFTYEIQDKPEGIAQALLIGETFIDNECCTLILGDNIYADDIASSIKSFKIGAKILVKEVHDPERFGVVEIGKNKNVINLEEKPKKPKSNYALTGCYIFDERAVKYAKIIKPSKRGEYEIVDIINIYLEKGEVNAEILKGEWIDAGTFESLYKASRIAREQKLGMGDMKLKLGVKFKKARQIIKKSKVRSI